MDWKRIAPWNWFKDEERARDDGSARPTMDIMEGRKHYTIDAELPGVQPADVSVVVHGHTLVIRAEKQREREEDEEGYHCVERYFGVVQRVLSLPDDADPNAIEADFKHGVLRVRIGRIAGSGSAARTIEIRHA